MSVASRTEIDRSLYDHVQAGTSPAYGAHDNLKHSRHNLKNRLSDLAAEQRQVWSLAIIGWGVVGVGWGD